MQEFICSACHSEFTEDDVRIIHETEVPNGSACPFCGDEEYVEAFECEECGEKFTKEKIVEGTDLCVICEEAYQENEREQNNGAFKR